MQQCLGTWGIGALWGTPNQNLTLTNMQYTASHSHKHYWQCLCTHSSSSSRFVVKLPGIVAGRLVGAADLEAPLPSLAPEALPVMGGRPVPPDQDLADEAGPVRQHHELMF